MEGDGLIRRALRVWLLFEQIIIPEQLTDKVLKNTDGTVTKPISLADQFKDAGM